MRQAVLNFGNSAIEEFGLSVFERAGVQSIEMLSCEESRGVLRIRVEERPDEQRLDAVDPIQWWERVSGEEGPDVYLVELAAPDAQAEGESEAEYCSRAARAERISVTERGVTVEFAGSQEHLSRAFDELEDLGVEFDLQKLRRYRADETPLETLTDRQREVLELAYDVGYYDVPRRGSTQQIANEVGLDDSTVAEHLQRAERNLLTAVLEGG